MILHIGVTQETMESIGPNDTMNPIDIIKNRFRNTYTIVLTAHAHQVVFALEIYAHAGIMNIHALIHRYEICHVLDV